jgi:hypothetical protein
MGTERKVVHCALERKRRPTGFTDEHDTVLFFSTFPFARSCGVHTGLGFDE